MSIDISCWQTPPQTLCLAEGEIHLWRISLVASKSTLDLLETILTPDESVRAKRFIDPKKAEDFIVARARLRQVLGQYLNINPASLVFSYNDKGKPALHTRHDSEFTFNLAHSGEWALLALARGAEIGVDLEQIDQKVDYSQIAEQFFNPKEKAAVEKFPPQRQRRGFYRVWVQKEAGLKRNGFGFSGDLSTDTLDQQEFSRLFPISINYLGAIATNSEPCTIQRYRFY